MLCQLIQIVGGMVGSMDGLMDDQIKVTDISVSIIVCTYVGVRLVF